MPITPPAPSIKQALRADNEQLRAENAKLREKLDLPPKTFPYSKL